MDIDQEWENFISSEFVDDEDEEGNSSVEGEYSKFDEISKDNDEEIASANITMDIESVAPKATNIYISTKTKIAYLNTIYYAI